MTLHHDDQDKALKSSEPYQKITITLLDGTEVVYHARFDGDPRVRGTHNFLMKGHPVLIDGTWYPSHAVLSWSVSQ